MVKNKTTQTKKSVTAFIKSEPDERKRNENFRIGKLMKSVTGFEPKMWGPSIIGFGSYHYKYDSGHEGDAPLAGFSPKKDALVLYLAIPFSKTGIFLQKLGKHKAGKWCIYIKKLEDVNMDILKKMIVVSVKYMNNCYQT